MDGDVTKFMRSSDVIPRRVAGELILVPVNSRSVVELSRAAELFTLNETAQFLWDELGEAQTAEELARKLMSTYRVSAEIAMADVQAFLEALLAIRAVIAST